ncbi:Uncharacterised protein [Chlamydia trachomatis]|nr:Uncharacterised protein [Chlamydia trachomatis]
MSFKWFNSDSNLLIFLFSEFTVNAIFCCLFLSATTSFILHKSPEDTAILS